MCELEEEDPRGFNNSPTKRRIIIKKTFFYDLLLKDGEKKKVTLGIMGYSDETMSEAVLIEESGNKPIKINIKLKKILSNWESFEKVLKTGETPRLMDFLTRVSQKDTNKITTLEKERIKKPKRKKKISQMSEIEKIQNLLT